MVPGVSNIGFVFAFVDSLRAQMNGKAKRKTSHEAFGVLLWDIFRRPWLFLRFFCGNFDRSGFHQKESAPEDERDAARDDNTINGEINVLKLDITHQGTIAGLRVTIERAASYLLYILLRSTKPGSDINSSSGAQAHPLTALRPGDFYILGSQLDISYNHMCYFKPPLTKVDRSITHTRSVQRVA